MHGCARSKTSCSARNTAARSIPEPTDARDIPDYHVGTSAKDVKIWVEQMARGLGYDRVEWDELPAGVAG